MSDIDRFFQVIEIADDPISGGYEAYKMDEMHDKFGMKRFVGLKECNSSDYFLPYKNSIVLIEETRLSESIEVFKEEYDYLELENKIDFAIKQTRNEMRLKVYGSMLILCRLTIKSDYARKMFQGKRFAFWLVSSNLTIEDARAFDNIHDDLLSALHGSIGDEIIEDVQVISSDVLVTRLSRLR